MQKRQRLIECAVHGVFLLLGLIPAGCVLLITVYLVLPGIRQIGLSAFLPGDTWESAAAQPSFGILPFTPAL